MEFQKKLASKKIAVFGLGVSGQSTIRLLSQLGADFWAINRGEVTSWPPLLVEVPAQRCLSEASAEAQKVLTSVDLIILSPGIAREHPALRQALERGVPVWNEIELAYRLLPSRPTVAITGTNGKTTTTTMLGEFLKSVGKQVFVGGNIGVPFCDEAWRFIVQGEVSDFYILELSSFQLESLELFHPQVAIILNISMSHGERYEQFASYAAAKWNIIKNLQEQDTFIGDARLERRPIPRAQCTWVDQNYQEKIFSKVSLENFKLVGAHNRENLTFCLGALQALGLGAENFQGAIDQFKAVAFRLERVEGEGRSFLAFNDAKSTNWEATHTALAAIEELKRPIWCILGGQLRGQEDHPGERLVHFKGVEKVLLFAESGKEILEDFQKAGFSVDYFQRLEDVIDFVHARAFSGVLLFSPAFPSFDQYANYVQRGKHFNQLLRGI